MLCAVMKVLWHASAKRKQKGIRDSNFALSLAIFKRHHGSEGVKCLLNFFSPSLFLSPFSVRQQRGLDSVLYANLQQILINLCSSSNCKSSAAPSVGLCLWTQSCSRFGSCYSSVCHSPHLLRLSVNCVSVLLNYTCIQTANRFWAVLFKRQLC